MSALVQKMRLAGLSISQNSRGWIELNCPFCNRPHLGFHPETNTCFCWYCGKHPVKAVFSRILGISEEEVGSILGKKTKRIRTQKKEEVHGEFQKPLTVPLMESHRVYLEGRGFDPDRLVREWFLESIPPLCPDRSLRNRIYIPLVYNEQVVSWQARSVFKTTNLRYLTASKDKEIRFHKKCLYGWDYAKALKRAIMVEGPADVWKLGPGAVHGFGVQYSDAQLSLLASLEKVFIVFDNEPKAQRLARKLGVELESLGTSVEIVNLEDYKDPGEAPMEEARQLARTLLRGM